MKQHHQDPSRHVNTRSRLTTAAAGAFFLSAALLGAVADRTPPVKSPRATAPAAPVLPSETVPKTPHEALNARIRNATIVFASSIATLYARGGEDVEAFSEQSSENPRVFQVGIKKRVGTTAGGDYGEYFLMAEMEKDSEGTLDPSTASSVFIGMDNRNFEGTPELGQGNFYGVDIVQMESNWRVIHHADSRLGDGPVIWNSTEPTAGTGPRVLQSFDLEYFNRPARQVSDVLIAASQGTPVSYPSPA